MFEFVERPNSLLGGWSPCPFARKARLSSQVKVIFADENNLDASITEAKTLLEDNDVIAVCFDHKIISAETIQTFVIARNLTLMLEDYVILEDHPDAPEFVNGVQMNFGKCGLLLIQRLSKLTEASDQLKSKGYYDHWDRKAIDEVVTWRKN